MRYFISGHRELTFEDFDNLYIPKIVDAIIYDSNAKFLVGSYMGCDMFALQYLLGLNCKVTVYGPSMPFGIDENKEHLVTYVHTNDYQEADELMTNHSDYDIAFIYKGREDSHTAKNILRRHLIKKV